MMKTMKVFVILALISIGAPKAWAQVDGSGQKVKRITFDREQVKIEYADGSTKAGVAAATIVNDRKTSGIKDLKPETGKARRRWYTVDGRALQNEPRQKGVYVVREKNVVKKTIKK